MRKSKEKVFITNSMRSELRLIYKVLSSSKTFSLEKPLAHVMFRELDLVSYGDTSL